MVLYIIFLLLGVLLLSGCLTEHPATQVPTTVSLSGLTFYTEERPPYNYRENDTLHGISIDLFEVITEKMGEKVSHDQVNLVSWSEGYQAALTGNNTMIFAIARIPERETSFKWAGPINPYTTVLFARPDRKIIIKGPEDLKWYRIGVIGDDAATQQLLDIGVNKSQLVMETNGSELVAMLQNGEIDLWGYSEVGGRYLTRQVTGNYNSFRVVYAFPDIPIYYAFSKDVPDATVQAFQQALDALKTEKDATGISTYDRILGEYIPAIGLEHLTYLTEEWAPFNYLENGSASGISVDILEAVFRDIGVNRTRADVHIVPLADGFEATQNGTSTVLFSIVRSQEREPFYKWAGPFTKARFVIFAPISRNISIASTEDLKLYRIGAVRGTIENSLLTSRGVNASQIVNGKDPEDLLRMLEREEIDLWAMGDLAGQHQIAKTAADPNAYEIVFTLDEIEFYYIFSRDVPDTLVSAFQQGLDTVRNQKDAQGVSEYERILYRYLGVGCTRQPFTDETVMTLVNTTSASIEQNASDTIRRINSGEAPYRDKENTALYAFVYDKNVTMVAHADNIRLVGVNYKGKTDVTGKPFRDQIVAGALANKTGWVEYVYVQPNQTNLYYKTTYFRLTEGSDGTTYIVCSGNFKGC